MIVTIGQALDWLLEHPGEMLDPGAERGIGMNWEEAKKWMQEHEGEALIDSEGDLHRIVDGRNQLKVEDEDWECFTHEWHCLKFKQATEVAR